MATPYLRASQSGVVHLAFSHARPVVSTDVGDLAEAVRDGESGLLVPPGDVALARVLERLLVDPALPADTSAEFALHAAPGRDGVLGMPRWCYAEGGLGYAELAPNKSFPSDSMEQLDPSATFVGAAQESNRECSGNPERSMITPVDS